VENSGVITADLPSLMSSTGCRGGELPVVSAATAYVIPTKELEQLFLLSDRRHSTIARRKRCSTRTSCASMVKVDESQTRWRRADDRSGWHQNPLDFQKKRICRSISVARPTKNSVMKFHWLIPEMPDSEPRSRSEGNRTALEGSLSN
jgi:hypothetical protein